jgi:hypothetical protein
MSQLGSVEEIDPAGWLAGFDDLLAEVVAPAFFRREPRLRAQSYLLGLVSGLEHKNAWTLAEFAGDSTPDGMQRLLAAARWHQDAVRDALGRYACAARRVMGMVSGPGGPRGGSRQERSEARLARGSVRGHASRRRDRERQRAGRRQVRRQAAKRSLEGAVIRT